MLWQNAYGMFKGRWRILNKKTEVKNFKLRYVFMECIMLHNLYIKHNDPCEPSRRLEINDVEF